VDQGNVDREFVPAPDEFFGSVERIDKDKPLSPVGGDT
jgi:hypothetical protein